MSARREKRLRALERRVEKLEAVAYMSTFYVTTGEKAKVEFMDAGWTRADDVTLVSSWKIILSTITRRSYAEAPVSPLKIFGKTQAFAYQKEVDGNPEKRHHVRFWKTPDGWLLPGGHQVDWLAAGT